MRRIGFAAWLALGVGWAAAQSGNPMPDAPPPPLCNPTPPRLDEVLAKVPVRFWALSSRTPSSCFPDALYGSGTVGAAEVQRLLRRAGYTIRVNVNAAPPNVFPPASDPTWPVSAEAIEIRPQKTGSRLKVGVRLHNWTVFSQRIGWAYTALNYVLLGQHGELVSWSGDGPRAPVAYPDIICPALQTCDTPPIYLSLDHFNPEMPLKPGRYTLRLRVDRVSVGDTLKLAATLPDQQFEVVR